MKVIASERIEPLVADLARTLVESPADPMTPEWIAVGSEGLQRWLQLELARHLGAAPGRSDGVAANIIFKSPGSLRTAVLTSGDGYNEFDPWLGDRLTWAVFETLKGHTDDPLLAAFGETETRTLFQRARVISQRFASYQMLRPEMVRSWATHDDVDAADRPIPHSQAWQPHLWRLVRAHLGCPSPAERLNDTLDRLRAGPVELRLQDQPLPQRLIFFGPSLLPTGAGFLEIAGAVAAHREVLTYVIEPSGALSRSLRGAAPDLVNGGRDVGADLAVNHLLRSWGRLQRETALLLAGLPLEVVEPEPRSRDTLLHAIQADVRDNAPAGASTGAFTLDPNDRSIQIHRCFGPTRQVEALRDIILGLLDDPTLDLTEDDIIVVCPNPEKFVPLIGATFGPCATPATSHASDGTPLIRYHITGIPGVNDNPVTDAFVQLLDLVTSRFDVTDVTDFLSQAAVRNRFRWTDDDVDRIIGWLDDTNVRWGLDGEHRSGFGLPVDVESFTLRTALDQLVLGTAIDSADDLGIGDVVPVGLAADNTTLIGQVAAVAAEFERLVDAAKNERRVSEWHGLLSEALDRLLAPAPDADFQMDNTRRVLTKLVDASRLPRGDTTLDPTRPPEPSPITISFREFREQFKNVLGEQRSRSDFFRGGINITTLNALRNVPAKVICVLGADQSAFSAGGASSDDLIAVSPRPGDRDRRAEIRQTLLDALLAAKDRLIFLADGFDIRTNAQIPHAVLITELLDTINQTCGGQEQSQLVITDHKLHTFAESYFLDGSDVPRSFNKAALDSACARRNRSAVSNDIDWPQVRLNNPVVAGAEQIDLETLAGVLKDPTKVFLRDGLGIRLPGELDRRTPELPLEINTLEKWRLGTTVLGLLRETGDASSLTSALDKWTNREILLGNLPPLSIALPCLDEIMADALPMHRAESAAGVGQDSTEAVSIELDLDNGRRLTGRIDLKLIGDQHGVVNVRFAKYGSNDDLRAWLQLMALTAHDDSTTWRALIINKPSSNSDKKPSEPSVNILTTGSTSSAAARSALTLVADLYDTATRQPVPLFPGVFKRGAVRQPKDQDWKHQKRPLSPEILYIYGDISVTELRAIKAAGHPLIKGDEPLAEAYASLIWDAFDATVSFVSEESHDD